MFSSGGGERSLFPMALSTASPRSAVRKGGRKVCVHKIWRGVVEKGVCMCACACACVWCVCVHGMGRGVEKERDREYVTYMYGEI